MLSRSSLAVDDLGAVGADDDRHLQDHSDTLERVQRGVAGSSLDGAHSLGGKTGRLRDVTNAKAPSLSDQAYLFAEHGASPARPHLEETLRDANDESFRNVISMSAKVHERRNRRGQELNRTWTQVTEGHLRDLYDTIETYKSQLSIAIAVLLSLGFDLEDFADLLP